jgi:hypothetical protein
MRRYDTANYFEIDRRLGETECSLNVNELKFRVRRAKVNSGQGNLASHRCPLRPDEPTFEGAGSFVTPPNRSVAIFSPIVQIGLGECWTYMGMYAV